MRWLVARADGRSCPQTACSWTWTDDPGRRVSYYGIGMGQAGIVLALDGFADRTGDASFRAHARAGAAWLQELIENGTRPLPRGSDEPTTFETGFLSGSAGAAYLFLERYRRDRDPVDLATARALLAWVDNQGVVDAAGHVSWPFAAHSGAWTAAGFELGVAGITWVNLQAARTTGDAVYRERARQAGRWLRHVGLGGLGRSCLAIAHLGCTSGSTAAPQGSAGCSKTWPARVSTRRRIARPRARRLRACVPRLAATASGHSGTRAGPAHVAGSLPSPPGTGAPPGSPPSRPGSAAGRGGLPVGSAKPDSPGPDLTTSGTP
jgi:hypothetical protein